MWLAEEIGLGGGLVVLTGWVVAWVVRMIVGVEPVVWGRLHASAARISRVKAINPGTL
jgi:hypothetical protein